jgi:hypothetical protein
LLLSLFASAAALPVVLTLGDRLLPEGEDCRFLLLAERFETSSRLTTGSGIDAGTTEAVGILRSGVLVVGGRGSGETGSFS